MPTPNDIKDFAVAYEAFWDTLRATDRGEVEWNALSVWSRLLKENQITVGVEIIPPATLDGHRDKARAEMAKIETIKREKRDFDARHDARQDATDIPPEFEPNR